MMNVDEYKLPLKKVIEEFELEKIYETDDLDSVMITNTDVNRPGLQMVGFFDYFDNNRIQIMGKVEFTYLEQFHADERAEKIEKLMSQHIPALIVTRGLQIFPEMIELAEKYNVPLLRSESGTSAFMSALIAYLNVQLAPCIVIHGVLVDVYGTGVLITGESGIGKSEAALELIKRGHRLVTDDAVEIRKVSDETLIGTAPGVTKYFIELRGIGIIDVKTLFGVESIKETQQIDMVMKLEDWNKDREYDRLGLEEEYTEYLGNKVVCHALPIRPGRNLAVIVEAAAVNHRQKKMGYNAAKELYRRVQENLMKGEDDDE